MDPVPEIRREKVFLQPGMSSEEIKKSYGLSSEQAYKARKKGWFVKNYSKKQVVIDRENFNSAPIAKSQMAAHERGVKVEIILDKSNLTAQYTSCFLE
jgi:hypothetical protein